jgi:hypothetical protein
VRELLQAGALGEAEVAINEAESVAGTDSPLRRYRTLLTIARATETDGLMDEDRTAMLAEARRLALAAIKAAPEDKYSYGTFARVGQARFDLLGRLDYFDEALEMLQAAHGATLDPELAELLDNWERKRLPLHERAT